MDFFQCLGVLLVFLWLPELLMTSERGSLWSGGEGIEATLHGEMEEATSSESVKNKGFVTHL